MTVGHAVDGASTRPAPRPPSMARVVFGVVFSSFVYGATVALGFGLVLAIGGEARVLEPESWQITPTVQLLGVLIAGIGAFFAGTLCRLVIGDARISLMFSVLLLVLVTAQGLSRFGSEDAPTRREPGDRGAGTIAQNVQPGPIALIGLPLAAAVMSYAGGATMGRVQRFFLGR
ncbi:MAG: hypothetical protein JNK53_05530 [Phycisphaerae bacterium]|nr:hypothetical protein [Phycisphaerae bacterium]